jgi:hypothetical protein
VKIVVDYDDDAERERLEPRNPGAFPLTFSHVDDFVLCGTRTPGAPVMHKHGNAFALIRHAVVVVEDLRLTIQAQLLKEAVSGRTDP